MLKLISLVAAWRNDDPHLSMDKGGVNRTFLSERPQPPAPMRPHLNRG